MLALVVIPVLAALCLGMLVRALVDVDRSWVVWLVVLAAFCALWLYLFTEPPLAPR